MKFLGLGSVRRSPDEDRELDEWDYHHNSSHQRTAEAFFNALWMGSERTEAEWFEAHQNANHMIGNRAPADYGEFLAYGYTQGRLDAMRQKS